MDAVLVVRALLAVVEDGHQRQAAAGGVLEDGEDRRVAALHVGGSASDDARPGERGRVPVPGRHGVEVPDQRERRRARRPAAGDHAVADPLDGDALQRPAAPLDEVRQRGLLARHARHLDELEREAGERPGGERGRHQAWTPKPRSASLSDVLRSVLAWRSPITSAQGKW